MTARFLLDTNIISDVVRNPQGRIASKIAAIGEDSIVTSAIVAAELRYGAAKKESPRLTGQLNSILAVIEIVAFEPPADRAYGAVRTTLEARGEVIGANDMLIAAQAIAMDVVLVTDNMREFSRVDGLKTENWLR